MEETTILLRIIDKLPSNYLMFLITSLMFYYIIHKLCKTNARFILKYFSKIKLQNDNINQKLDSIEEKINNNTNRIMKLENINKRKKEK